MLWFKREKKNGYWSHASHHSKQNKNGSFNYYLEIISWLKSFWKEKRDKTIWNCNELNDAQGTKQKIQEEQRGVYFNNEFITKWVHTIKYHLKRLIPGEKTGVQCPCDLDHVKMISKKQVGKVCPRVHVAYTDFTESQYLLLSMHYIF